MKWYRIENLTAGGADVFIYDEIGSDGIGATDFVKEIGKVKGPINLHLNTPGGEVYDGIAIYTALKDRGDVTVFVDSLAASIGSVIAMAGSRIVMAKHATMMIHDAMGALQGNAAEMQKFAERLELTSDEIASVYQEHAGDTVKVWRDRMRSESWYNAQQAVEVGLADEVASAKDKVTDLTPRVFNLSKFKNVPEWVKTQPVIEDSGRVMSKANLEQLHSAMGAMKSVHGATCDLADKCPVKDDAGDGDNEGVMAKTKPIKNQSDDVASTTVTACLGARLHEVLTDTAQDWLESGLISMDEFLPLSGLVTALIASLDAGLDKIGISDRSLPLEDNDEPEGYRHVVTETFGVKDDELAVGKVETAVVAKAEGEESSTEEDDEDDPETVDDEDETPVKDLVAIDFTKIFAQALEA